MPVQRNLALIGIFLFQRYGVREHGMGAIMNGIAAYGPGLVIPAAGTFLNFVSYAAGAVRLAALSHLRVIWVATHDSIGLGEDGPTHQPGVCRYFYLLVYSLNLANNLGFFLSCS